MILRYAFFFLLVFSGAYTLLAYLGVPAHQAVLLTTDTQQSIAATCGSNTFCQEWHALFPFLFHTIQRASPFLWYVIWSVVALLVLLGREFMKSGEWRIRFTMNPAKMLMGFFLSVWLLMTVLSVGSEGGDMSMRRLYDATADVYPNASQAEIQSLSDNLNDLKARGCVKVVGQLQSGANAHDMTIGCMQESFFTRVFTEMVMVLVIMFSMLVIGTVVLRKLLRVHPRTTLLEFLFAFGLGTCVYMALLWFLSLLALWLHLPLYSMPVGWIVVLGIPVVCYRYSLEWIKRSWTETWTHDAPVYGGALILGWMLLTYLAFNFLTVIRPFPIGWDDLGEYLNQPHLLVSYGHFIPTMASFTWEYVTSIGFLLFGYNSAFGTTLAMLMNWMAGIPAFLAIYAFGRQYLGRGSGLLAALIYYTLPLVGHFSFADMKIDNAVFALGALSMLALFLTLFRQVDDEDKEEVPEQTKDGRRKWIILAGVLGSFAFAVKATAIMVFMTVGSVLIGSFIGVWGFIGAVSLSWFLFTQQNHFDVASVSSHVYGNAHAISRPLVMVACIVIGLAALAYGFYRKPGQLRPTFTAVGWLVLSFVVCALPWLIYNNIASGNLIPQVELLAPNTYEPLFVIGKGEPTPKTSQPVKALPNNLRVDMNNPSCVSTATAEELDRYWGYDIGWGHYLTLPWRSVMNLDSAGYYVTMIPALLLFPLLLILPFFWMKQARWLRWMFGGTVFLLVQWVFFANGVPWYGIGTFLGLVIALEVFVKRAPDKTSEIAACIIIALSFFNAYAHRIWQFEQQVNLIEYPIGKISAAALRERTITHYNDISNTVLQRYNSMPNQPYLYRVGTFISYFIPQNLQVIGISDQQLDFFNCLDQERNPQLTLQRLQALGFNDMVFDTNTQTIETNPNGTLHKKVQAFEDFVNTPNLGITLPVDDPDNGIAYILLPSAKKP